MNLSAEMLTALAAIAGVVAAVVGTVFKFGRQSYELEQTRKDVGYLASELKTLKERAVTRDEITPLLAQINRAVEGLVNQVQLLREAMAAAGLLRRHDTDFNENTPTGPRTRPPR